jgi:hypothetical protein
MNPELPPPFPNPPPQPPKRNHTTRNVLLGCGLALLIGVGLIALILIEVCSGLNNMH